MHISNGAGVFHTVLRGICRIIQRRPPFRRRHKSGIIVNAELMVVIARP